MKTTYRRDNQFVFYRPSQKRFLAIIVPLVLAGGLFFFGDILMRGLDSPMLKLFYPFLKAEQIFSANTEDLKNFFHSKKFLVASNNSLAEENIKLKNQLVAFRLLEVENDNLKQELLLPNRSSFLLSGYVVSRPNLVPYDSLLIKIDKNLKDRLKIGDLVTASDGVLIGKVIDISGSLVKVEMISSPDKKLPIIIGRNAVVTEATGIGGGNFYLELPRGISINIGDPVASDQYPGYLVGTVGEIVNTPADPFQVIKFRLPVNIYNLRVVEFHAG